MRVRLQLELDVSVPTAGEMFDGGFYCLTSMLGRSEAAPGTELRDEIRLAREAPGLSRSEVEGTVNTLLAYLLNEHWPKAAVIKLLNFNATTLPADPDDRPPRPANVTRYW